MRSSFIIQLDSKPNNQRQKIKLAYLCDSRPGKHMHSG